MALFKVKINYREPTYAASRNASPKAYSWTYEVSAANPLAARRRAVEDFRDTARLSSVGWVREIVSTEVTPTRVRGSARA